MNVDMISALEAREAEQPSSASSKGEGDFPNVLQSSMGRDEAGHDGSSREGSSEREADRAHEPRDDSPREDERSAKSDDDGTREEHGTSEEGADPSDASEASSVSEAAAAGGAAAAVLDRARAALGLEAENEHDGRITALDDERAGLDAGVARDGAADAADSEALLDGTKAEAAREVLEAVQTGHSEVATDATTEALEQTNARQTATQTEISASVAADGAVGPNGTEEAIVREAALASDAQADAEREGHAGAEREDAHADRSDPSQAAFDQALDGARGEGIDPNLRQALVNRDEATRAAETIAVAGAPAVANPVAGAVVETTTSVPGQPAPAPATDAISVQTEWLATRGGGTARLVLHPPELGELTIRVTLRGGNVDVMMVAQEAVAQSIAEEQSDRLSQAFASRDLRMDQFEVRRGDPNEFADSGFGRFDGSGAERDGQADGDGDGRAGDGSEAPRGLLGRQDSGPEHPPQIVSAGPEASVDLRA